MCGIKQFHLDSNWPAENLQFFIWLWHAEVRLYVCVFDGEYEQGEADTMIIAAYAGTGKTRFANTVYDAVDFVCMSYKYHLPDGIISCEEAENIKADLSLELRAEWPET